VAHQLPVEEHYGKYTAGSVFFLSCALHGARGRKQDEIILLSCTSDSLLELRLKILANEDQ
jgi:hypothetical protein